ncbi:MAG: OsmC family protein [Gemmatimonadaceae bacterium]|nr:OsmC family protein [Gemmatimonadaceae bacterium]
MSTPPKRVAEIRLDWQGEHRFDTGRPGGPTLRLDGDGVTGQSPVDAVVSALAACTAVDVVDIMAKRRTPLASLGIDAVGSRAETIPRRLTEITLTYHVAGEGVERVHVERAIDLAITRYCSVRESLDPAMPVRYRAVVNGEDGAMQTPGSVSQDG